MPTLPRYTLNTFAWVILAQLNRVGWPAETLSVGPTGPGTVWIEKTSGAQSWPFGTPSLSASCTRVIPSRSSVDNDAPGPTWLVPASMAGDEACRWKSSATLVELPQLARSLNACEAVARG